MANHCYYCGAEGATRPLQISPTFTAAGMIKVAHSNVMCDRCHGIMFGDIQRVWYHNKDEDRWVSLYLRGIHQLWQGDTLLHPQLGEPEEHTQVSAAGKMGKPTKYSVLSSVPKRLEVRDWLLNPPEPPFTIAIAETGQKHILFLAQTGYDRNSFPVQFEMDSLMINRSQFASLLSCYEDLLSLSFSKTEVDSGNYRPDRLIPAFDKWQELEPIIANHRSGGKPSRLLQLISFVATKPEYTPPPEKPKQEKAAEKVQPVKVAKEEKAKNDGTAQLSLF